MEASAMPLPASTFDVVLRTWHGGRKVDEQLVAQGKTFEEATRISQRLTHDRVRLNNNDVTVSVEPSTAAAPV